MAMILLLIINFIVQGLIRAHSSNSDCSEFQQTYQTCFGQTPLDSLRPRVGKAGPRGPPGQDAVVNYDLIEEHISRKIAELNLVKTVRRSKRKLNARIDDIISNIRQENRNLSRLLETEQRRLDEEISKLKNSTERMKVEIQFLLPENKKLLRLLETEQEKSRILDEKISQLQNSTAHMMEKIEYLANTRDLCKVVHDDRCFWFVISEDDVNYQQKRELCVEKHGIPANVYNANHYETLVRYAREMIPERKSVIGLWLGSTYNHVTKKVLGTGSENSAYVKWWSSSYPHPHTSRTQMGLYVSSSSDGMGNWDPNLRWTYGIVCELQKRRPRMTDCPQKHD